MERDVVALLEWIIRGTNDLRGAACTACPDLFNTAIPSPFLGHTNASRWALVQATCKTCPARAACWAWAAQTPNSGASGPTAATLINPFGPPRNRKRTAA
ncbi:hypothetical protein ACVWY6_003865 [Williamsia sp. R60]